LAGVSGEAWDAGDLLKEARLGGGDDRISATCWLCRLLIFSSAIDLAAYQSLFPLLLSNRYWAPTAAIARKSSGAHLDTEKVGI